MNLSANVTDLILLEHGEHDRRLDRAHAAAVTMHHGPVALGITLPPTSTATTAESPRADPTIAAGTSEHTMLLAEIYRRGTQWRVRAIGQGYDDGLAELATRYGVDVA